MKIYFISPVGKKSDLLFDTFISAFEGKGHKIVNHIQEGDVVFFDVYSRLGTYYLPDVDYANLSGLPVVMFDATDYGGMSKEEWHKPRVFLNNQVIYFIRKMDKTLEYPKWVYPYEVIIYPDHDFTPVSKEELFNRPYDICFIGNTSPTRQNVVNGLLNAGFKMDIHWTNEKGKLSHDEWLDRHRQAKFFLSADGGGFSDERSYQLITIAPMLKNRNNHLQANPFKDGVNCWQTDELPTRFDIEDLQLVLSDKNMLYDIYISGIDHMKKYYTAEYRAEYILKTLEENGIN